MEYNKLIAGMHTGDDVEGFYVLKDAFLKTTAAGKPFLSGVLADRSGTIDLKVWDYSGPIGANPADTGRIVKIRGQVSEFKGGKVHHITGNLYHLMRGQVYDFDGVSVFAMGGGESPDIDIRSDLESWSGDEIPTEAELDWMMPVSTAPTSTPSIGLVNSRNSSAKPGTSFSPDTAALMASMPNISVAKPSRITPVSFFLSDLQNI